MITYNKVDDLEEIVVGDLITLDGDNRATRSFYDDTEYAYAQNVVGVCVSVENDIIGVETFGVNTINTVGDIGNGQLFTLSREPGKVRLLQYAEQEQIPDIKVYGQILQRIDDNKAVAQLSIK